MQVRKSKFIGKRMVTVFFTKGGILTTFSLEKSETVTAKWYTETCLLQLFENLVPRAPLHGEKFGGSARPTRRIDVLNTRRAARPLFGRTALPI